MTAFQLGDMAEVAWHTNIGGKRGVRSQLARLVDVDSGKAFWRFVPDPPPDDHGIRNSGLETALDGKPRGPNLPYIVRKIKPRYDLIPPAAAYEEARVLASVSASGQYPDWEFDPSYSANIRAALSHIMSFQDRDDLDATSLCQHLAHARARLGILLHLIATSTGKDDRRPVTYVPVEDPQRWAPEAEAAAFKREFVGRLGDKFPSDVERGPDPITQNDLPKPRRDTEPAPPPGDTQG